MLKHAFVKVSTLAAGATLLGSMGGCATFAPLPGPALHENQSCFASPADMRQKLAAIKDGASLEDVHATLFAGHPASSCVVTEMSQPAIYDHLKISNDNQNLSIAQRLDQAREFRNTMTGEQVRYCAVTSKIGFSSPIRWQTKQRGFCYTVTMIFNQGKLFGRPDVSDDDVNKTSSKTIIDGISPGSALRKIL